MCDQYLSLYREYRVMEMIVDGNKEYHIQYYYNPYPITEEYKLGVKLWIDFFKTNNRILAIDMCKLYKKTAEWHLKHEKR